MADGETDRWTHWLTARPSASLITWLCDPFRVSAGDRKKKRKKNPASFLVSATNVSRWLMYFNWSRSDFFPSLILFHGLIYFNKCKLIIRHFPNKDGRPLNHLASLQTQQMFTEAFSFFSFFFLFTRHWDLTGKIFIFKLSNILWIFSSFPCQWVRSRQISSEDVALAMLMLTQWVVCRDKKLY